MLGFKQKPVQVYLTETEIRKLDALVEADRDCRKRSDYFRHFIAREHDKLEKRKATHAS